MPQLKFDRRNFGSYTDTQVRYMQIGWNKHAAAQASYETRIEEVRSALVRAHLDGIVLAPSECATLALKLEMTNADVPA